jgi:hypothetical protein
MSLAAADAGLFAWSVMLRQMQFNAAPHGMRTFDGVSTAYRAIMDVA